MCMHGNVILLFFCVCYSTYNVCLLFFQEIEMFAEVKLELQAVTQTNMEKFSHLEAFSYIQTLEKFKRLSKREKEFAGYR